MASCHGSVALYHYYWIRYLIRGMAMTEQEKQTIRNAIRTSVDALEYAQGDCDKVTYSKLQDIIYQLMDIIEEV